MKNKKNANETIRDGKDFQNLQKGSDSEGSRLLVEQVLPELQHEIHDKSHDQQYQLLDEFQRSICSLHRIFEVQRNETASYPDDLPTSFASVETEIAKYISKCLADVAEHSRKISDIQALLRANRVVVLLRDQSCSVSLHRLHVILQDNYQDSCLCKLLNVFLAGFIFTKTTQIANIHIKTIDF